MGPSPFHAGELEVQRRLGVDESIGAWASQVIRDAMPEQHRDFYRELPFLVAAARDRSGRPWATLLAGAPGFVESPDPRRLSIRNGLPAGDALEGELEAGVDLGLLGIELSTRRRNRVNGRLLEADSTRLELEVGQAFGNCPQYIREREWESVPASEAGRAPSRAQRLRNLDPEQRAWIEAADTFFVASGHRGEGDAAYYGMDASHRGGPRGFVGFDEQDRLVFPDYAGNNHFNTIGNLMKDPRAGLLFVDFDTGGLLQLTGRTEIDWDPENLKAHPGAQRLVRFTLDEAVHLPDVLPIRWHARVSPPADLRVIGRTRESEDVMSFELAPTDGSPLLSFAPGQHLPVSFEVEGVSEPIRRTYSLSNAPGEAFYRISVKREPEGLVSKLLHDEAVIGARLAAGAPAGDFQLQEGTGAIVLISAGIGVTPLESMLATHVARADRRPLDFFHVARDGAHHPLAAETRSFVETGAHRSLHVFYTKPGENDRRGRDFDEEGRPDAQRILERLGQSSDRSGERVDFYLCGPIGFMAEIQRGLESSGIPVERIHSESFGPS